MEEIEKRRQKIKEFIRQKKLEEKQKADLTFINRIKEAKRLSVNYITKH